MKAKINWPDGKRFAFTVFDDTDHMTIQNGPLIYQYLHNLGFLTTKSVWPIRGGDVPRIGGSTCEDPDYRAWIHSLKEQGFELALHNVTYHTSNREQTNRGLEQFKQYFGSYPNIQANHAYCRDGVYWGDARLSAANRLFYNFLTHFKNHMKFQGHLESSKLFWGDICKQRIKYVRNFIYNDINTLNSCPYMPYFDKQRSFVNYWFASSEGPDCHSFTKTISEQNQDRLEEEGGACIMYTHFGVPGFYCDGQLNPRFKQLMERLSRKSGWFVPVSTLLDYIIEQRGHYSISVQERFQLEWKWLIEKTLMIGELCQ